MKKLLASVCLLFATNVFSAELIKIYSPYSPAHSGTPALLKIVDEANALQSVYKFVVEFKPGGNQIIAVKFLDENSVAVIAPAYVENVASGKLDANNYTPIYALGDACWVGITNVDLKNRKELVVGGVSSVGRAMDCDSVGLS